MKHMKHLLAAMISVACSRLRYNNQGRKFNNGFWNDIKYLAIYLERCDNPYRPLK